MNFKNFKHYLRTYEGKIIIFGSGVFGIMIALYCEKNSIQVDCFCDNNIDIIGTKKNGLEIKSLKDIISNYNKLIFLISPIEERSQQEILKQLNCFGAFEYYTSTYFMNEVYKVDSKFIEEENYLKPLNITNNQHIDSNEVYIKHLDLSITEKCSLNCRDCAHFMPYYKSPKHMDKNKLLDYIDRVDEIFDIVDELNILGGEPLINPDVYDIIQYAQTKKSIKKIHIVTNGTIIPDKKQLALLDKTKLLVVISKYKLSTKIDDIINICKELNIDYNCIIIDEWTESNNLNIKEKSISELRNIYHWCFARNCHIVVDGKLFNCAFLSNTYRLKAIPQKSIQFIDLMDDMKTINEIKEGVKHYLYGQDYLYACNYCKGRSLLEINPIPSAIQTKEIIPYKKYD